MQPYHGNPPGADRTIWNRNVGAQREPFAFAWSSLLVHGATLAFGSDWPIVAADPRLGIGTAMTRVNEDGLPPGGWQPQERLTLAQALHAYTRGAAFAERQEEFKGMLRRGMVGDVTVFSEDLFALDPADIPQVPIAATIVAGVPVYAGTARL
jgi:predicted amidohydrolase YtcJ